ncbi:hypothetical protein CC78DRAFT_555398 [Lojkania enalia]|uniref:Dynamin-type G domain-containing protein n=1 Tax=Lojkania enalia TaxID=147567 RepID=A0A9P4K1G6_9PLEO|nr:hypothetical protein CC78DRAFT_555398 [Didymosphaeria enalia]
MPARYASIVIPLAPLLDKIDKLREINVKLLDCPQLVVVGDQSSGKSSVLESLTGFSFPQAPTVNKVSVSIMPHVGTEPSVEDRLRRFKRTLTGLINEALTMIFDDADQALGIKTKADGADSTYQAFNQHILKIEISVPNQEHFTVINLPGIFRNPYGSTTDGDVTLVRNMVKEYIENERTIILAVISSNADIVTQEILSMAETADPKGKRTMGVFTKPDLVMEKTTQELVKNLANRSPGDTESGVEECVAQEAKFFSKPDELLISISKKEFPNVRAEIEELLRGYENELETMGPSRIDQSSQRVYLGKIESVYRKITQCALNGHYDSKDVFMNTPSLKLITQVTKMNESFSDTVYGKGRKRHLSPQQLDDGGTAYGLVETDDKPNFDWLYGEYPELHAILVMYNYELLTHVSRSIMLVHNFIRQLLHYVFSEAEVLERLWETVLVEKLCEAYSHAMEHTRFLLRIERMRKKHQEGISAAIESKSTWYWTNNSKSGCTVEAIPVTNLKNLMVNKGNAYYYEASRKRFVDTICRQPTQVFCAELAMSLKDEELEIIAGEDEGIRAQRGMLETEIENLKKAMKVLRGESTEVVVGKSVELD